MYGRDGRGILCHELIDGVSGIINDENDALMELKWREHGLKKQEETDERQGEKEGKEIDPGNDQTCKPVITGRMPWSLEDDLRAVLPVRKSKERAPAGGRELQMVGKYKVITLCGSTRFKEEFFKAQKQLTLQGYIVISVGLFGHGGDSEVWEGMDEGTITSTKRMLDDMHKRKIDMSDEIFVINVGDYIGESTKSEIAYAKTHGKRVNYLEPHKVMYEDPTAYEAGACVPWMSGQKQQKALDKKEERFEEEQEPEDTGDLELLDAFMRSAAGGQLYSPDAATAALIAYQNGLEDQDTD